MEKKVNGKKKTERLRKWAEERAKSRAEQLNELSEVDVRKLAQELQIHQIELEMQNDELRRAQEELETSHRKYMDLYDFAPVGYCTLGKLGVINEINLTGSVMFDSDKNYLIGKLITDFLSPESQDVIYFHLKKVFDDGWRDECEVSVKAGKKESVTLRLDSLPQKDIEGKTMSCRTVMSDITERKRAEEEVKRLASYPELNPNPVIELDKAGKVHYLNPTAKELLGTKKPGNHAFLADIHKLRALDAGKADVFREVRVNDSWYAQAIHSVPGSDRIRVYSREITEHKKAEDELNKYRRDLERMVEERTAQLIKLNRNLEGEISNRKKMEEEIVKTQKLESVGVLAGGIAHDFNNALTAIMNNIAAAKMLLHNNDNNNRVIDTLETALKAVKRATGMTHQLLTFAKGGEPVRKTVYLRNLIKDTADFSLRGSSVGYEFHVEDDLWPTYVDEGQISQVISNLVINATQAMKGVGKVEVNAENIEIKKSSPLPLNPGKYLKLAVKDNGPGIPQKDISKVFDPYYTTKETGSGLGLATAYSIVAKHKGHIDVETKKGSGTTFIIYLPASEETVVKDETVGQKEFVEGRILVMDDEEDVRDSVRMMLKLHGYAADFTKDGDEAIRAYKKAMKSGVPYDAVVMDLTVRGGMGGEEALRKIKELDSNVKAIVASGYSNDPVMADHEKYGFVAALSKPYDVTDLSKILQKVMTAKKN